MSTAHAAGKICILSALYSLLIFMSTLMDSRSLGLFFAIHLVLGLVQLHAS